MISSSRDKDLEAKQEGGDGRSTDINVGGKISNKAVLPSISASTSSSSRQWTSAFRNPRIVRVSRSFGGKDRHSKVCTIRGLRDRRIRLSVPTAIQLYDLQERLGLSQPSKVVDWLLDATKSDIDKLPPLQMPPAGFGQLLQQQQPPMLFPHHYLNTANSSLFDHNISAFTKDVVGLHSLGIKMDDSTTTTGLDLDHGQEQNSSSTVLKSSYSCDIVPASVRAKSKQVETINEKGKWIKASEGEIRSYSSTSTSAQISAQNFFPLPTHQSNSSLLNNNPIYNIPSTNSYHQWDPSNLSLSTTQFGSHGFLSQTENSLTTPSSSVLPLSSVSHLFFCPPPPMPPLFPSYPPYLTSTLTPLENESREINHFQLFSTSTSSQTHHTLPVSRTMSSTTTKTFPLNLNPGLLHLQSNNESNAEEDNTDSGIN